MRRGELRALRWDDLDFDNGRLTVRRALVDDEGAMARTAASFDDAAASTTRPQTVDFRASGFPTRSRNATPGLDVLCRILRVTEVRIGDAPGGVTAPAVWGGLTGRSRGTSVCTRADQRSRRKSISPGK